MTTVAVRSGPRAVARPLKVLVPLIQRDLSQATSAGLEDYIAAGEKLLEAREQVPLGSWGRWLNKNFALGETTAWRYMRAAEVAATSSTRGRSLLELTGETEARRQHRKKHRKAWAPFKDATDDVDVESLNQARQSRQDELALHRNLMLEVIDIGYKALATRLHPDRGGSRDAMARLNRVRQDAKEWAKTRRFV